MNHFHSIWTLDLRKCHELNHWETLSISVRVSLRQRGIICDMMTKIKVCGYINGKLLCIIDKLLGLFILCTCLGIHMKFKRTSNPFW